MVPSFCCTGFIPHLCGEVVIPQIGEAARVGGQLVQHALQRTGMQGRQAGAARWCALFVIQLSKHGQRSVGHTHDAVAVASDVPFAIFGLDTTDCSGAIMGVTGIHGGGSKQIGQLVESRLVLVAAP